MKTLFMICEVSLKIFLVIVFYMISCFGKARMFSKAGEPAWQAWVPFYRMFVLNKIILGSGWFFICSYIPVIGIFTEILLSIDAARAYDHGEEKGFISALYFVFPWAVQYVLGFGPAKYAGACDVPQQLKYFFSGFDKEASKVSWTEEDDEFIEALEEPVGDAAAKPADAPSAAAAEESPAGAAGETAQKSVKKAAENVSGKAAGKTEGEAAEQTPEQTPDAAKESISDAAQEAGGQPAETAAEEPAEIK